MEHKQEITKIFLSLIFTLTAVFIFITAVNVKADETELSEYIETVTEQTQYTGENIVITPGDPGMEEYGMIMSEYDAVKINSLNGYYITGAEFTVGVNDIEDYENSFFADKGTVSFDGSVLTLSNVYDTEVNITTGFGLNAAISCVRVYYVRPDHLLSIELDHSELNLTEIGSSETLSVVFYPDYDGIDKTVIWSSSDTDVASVDDGVVTAVGYGQAIITATATSGTDDPEDDKTASCLVYVFKCVHYDFSDSLQGWTTIDADGDGYDWYLIPQRDTYNYRFVHETGSCAVISECFNKSSGELTPDNYLVSPQVPLGGVIRLYANALYEDFPYEHLGIFVSPLGNEDPAYFELVEEWTLTDELWQQFTIDLSAYEGMGYVAIRHYDVTNMYKVSVDDVSILYKPEDPALIEEPTAVSDLFYNGSARELVTEGSAEGGTMYYAVTTDYTAPEESAYSEALPTAVDAGTYYVWYKIKGDQFYNDSEAACITAEIKPPVYVTGVSGSFEDMIRLNFYFKAAEGYTVSDNDYVTLSGVGDGRTVTAKFSEALRSDEDEYIFSIPLYAKEAGEIIYANVYFENDEPIAVGGSSGTIYSENELQYSLMNYFSVLAESGKDEKTKALGAAAKDYCSAAQIYFGYNADGLTVSETAKEVTLNDLAGFAATQEGTLPDGVKLKGITAMLEADNTLRVYIKADEGVSLVCSIDGNTAELQTRTTDGSTYLALADGKKSNALHVANDYKFGDYTITASVLSYARSCLKSSSEDLQNLGKALYLYNRAAVDLFGDPQAAGVN